MSAAFNQMTVFQADLNISPLCRVTPAYHSAMFYSTRTIRTLIVTGLVLSLSLVGVSPILLAWQGEGAGASNVRGNGVCCCGTKDGRCCGMGCCKTSPPTEEHKAPAVPRSLDERSPAAVPVATFAMHSLANGATFHNAVSSGVPISGSPTLQMLQVRLNR